MSSRAGSIGIRDVPETEIREVDAVLGAAYDVDKTEVRADPPIDSLIRTILSQNTTDRSRDIAFSRIKERYPLWSDVTNAPLEDLIDAIRTSNHSPTKAARIQEILRQLSAKTGGEPSLDYLKSMDTETATRHLMEMKGVGKKTAACVLMFSLNRDVMPVDTHIHRVAIRLEWIGPRASRDAGHDILNCIVPEGLRYRLHVRFWEHGRIVCRPTPRCPACVIHRFCRYEKKTAPEPTFAEAYERMSRIPTAQYRAIPQDEPSSRAADEPQPAMEP